MTKIGQFIYPWGNGHYSRMMSLDGHLRRMLQDPEMHYCSSDHVYEKLKARFGDCNIHMIRMPMPVDGSFGPSITMSMANLLIPMRNRPPLVRLISDYLKKEGALYNKQKFDLVINDGDVGSNILADRRGIPSIFVTNQFRPRLYKSHLPLLPSLAFIARQISRASKILVADSPPPYTMCEYNLNFTSDIAGKVEYVGHFTDGPRPATAATSLGQLIEGEDFGYWMRTGNRSTNEITGRRYEKAFATEELAGQKRVISHAKSGDTTGRVLARDGRTYTIPEALDRSVDWVQIDVGFLSEDEKDAVLHHCRYAVVNGSHTVMGEVVGGWSKPIIGMPVYDEHTNQIRWAEERRLGILANSTKQVVSAIRTIREDHQEFQGALADFAAHFKRGGAARAAEIAVQMLGNK